MQSSTECGVHPVTGTDEPPADEPHPWDAIGAKMWTLTASETLTPDELDLFGTICCLEEPDRERWVLDSVWPAVWRHLHQYLAQPGEPPDLSRTVAAVSASGLVAIRPESGTAPESYAVHPEVAEVGRHYSHMYPGGAVDIEAALFWDSAYTLSSGDSGSSTADTGVAARAATAAVPYYIRTRLWDSASSLLERAFLRDQSRENAEALLPAAQEIVRSAPGPNGRLTMALIMQAIAPGAGESEMRDRLKAAVAAGDYRVASAIAGRLLQLCHRSGRLSEAFSFAELQIDHSTRAGLGPWTQLSDQADRLKVLVSMGQAGHVLPEVQRLRVHMATLPAVLGADESVSQWRAREGLLEAGLRAACLLSRWTDALDLNASLVVSKRERNAAAVDVARALFNDHGPLLLLRRTSEAENLLEGCLRVFEDARDNEMVGKTLVGLAEAADASGDPEAAVILTENALRNLYFAGDVNAIADCYCYLGDYLHHAGRPSQALSSHLAAALAQALIGDPAAGQSVLAAAADLRVFRKAAVPPASVAELERCLGHTGAIDLPRLVRQISPDGETAEELLRSIIHRTRKLSKKRRTQQPLAGYSLYRRLLGEE